MDIRDVSQPERKVFTAKDDNGRVVSIVELFVLPDIFYKSPAGYIHKVYTEPTRQKEGLASKLVQIALAYAKDIGCYKVFLVCHPENFKFYADLGFKKNQSEMVKFL